MSKTATKRKTGQVRVSRRSISQLHPSPENDQIYRPPNPDSTDIKRLARRIQEQGVLEPLVITQDGFIVSGHRRHSAAMLAGLEHVPCRVLAKRRVDYTNDEYVRLLQAHNEQREKSLDERIREEVINTNPLEANTWLLNHRRDQSEIHGLPEIQLREATRRARITKAKQPFLDAIEHIIYSTRKYWPLSDRRVHYALLNNPPLKHASKPDSTYTNDLASYKALCELLTRARLVGEIPMDAIADETRPVVTWKVWNSAGDFVANELETFLTGYWRDIQRSQPNHIEILVEKNSIYPIVRNVASRYHIPITSGRGYSSLPPRVAMSERFHKSGKDQLVLLVVSDFDPDGEEIAHSFARSMRDDLGIEHIRPIKVAITHDQVQSRNLPAHLDAKKGSSGYKRFVQRYGTKVAEVEALPPDDLEQIVKDAVDSVIDHDALDAEKRTQASDATYLKAIHKQIREAMADIGFDNEGEDQ